MSRKSKSRFRQTDIAFERITAIWRREMAPSINSVSLVRKEGFCFCFLLRGSNKLEKTRAGQWGLGAMNLGGH